MRYCLKFIQNPAESRRSNVSISLEPVSESQGKG
mgnify:CR=1 FL=1